MSGPRIIYANRLTEPGALIVPSSEASGLTRGALLRPLVSDVLRFKLGWTFGVWNNKLDFNRGGVRAATITSGNYPSTATAVEAVRLALEAIDSTPVWAPSYGSSKFTIAGDLAFTLLFGTGVNLFKSCAKDLGFAAADTGSATSQTAGLTSFQSRHAVAYDFGVGNPKSHAIGIVMGFNSGTGGTYRLQSDNVVDLTIEGFDYSGLGFFDNLLAGGATLRQAFFALQTTRYTRLLLSDVQNAIGYGEVGVLFAGPVLDLVGFALEVVDEREELSEVVFAVGGAAHQVRRGTVKVWQLMLHAIDDAKKLELEAFADAVRVGGRFFFNFDAADPANTRYVLLESGLSFKSQETIPRTWTVSLELKEAIG